MGSFATSVSVEDNISCSINVMKFQISQTHTGIYLAVGQMSLYNKILSYLVTSRIWIKLVTPSCDWITRQTTYLRRDTVVSLCEADTFSATLNSLIL